MNNTFSKVLDVLLKIMFVTGFLIFFCANVFHYTARMDGDVAGEAILAKEISDNNLRTPDSWFISTEERVIYPANLGAIIYHFSGNLNVSMGLACSVCGLLLIISMIALYRKVGMSSIAAWCAAFIPFVLTLNVHDALEMYILYAGYYFPVLFAFYIYGIFHADFIEGRIPVFNLIISVVLSIVLGMQGMRGLLMVFLPYTCVEIIRTFIFLIKNKKCQLKELFPLFWCCFLVVISYVSGKFLSEGVSSTSRNLRNGPAKLVNEVIPSVFDLFDTNGNLVYLLVVVAVCLIAVCFSVYVFIKKMPQKSAFFWASHWMSLFAMVAAMAFTTFDVSSRYSVFLFFAVGMSVGITLDNMESQMVLRNIFLAIIISCTVFSSSSVYMNLIKNDNSKDSVYVKIVDWMVENNVHRGYSTMDYAGIITLAGNGKTEVCQIDMTNLCAIKWLSSADWYPPNSDAGERVAIITTDNTDESFLKYIDENNLSGIIETSTDMQKFHCYILQENPVRLD